MTAAAAAASKLRHKCSVLPPPPHVCPPPPCPTPTPSPPAVPRPAPSRQANEILHHKLTLNGYLAEFTGQGMDTITADTDRDFFMSAQEAVSPCGLLSEGALVGGRLFRGVAEDQRAGHLCRCHGRVHAGWLRRLAPCSAAPPPLVRSRPSGAATAAAQRRHAHTPAPSRCRLLLTAAFLPCLFTHCRRWSTA